MSVVVTFSLALLNLAPAANVDRSESNTNESTRDDSQYFAIVESIRAALIEINTNPEATIDALGAALLRLRDFAPRLAQDPDTLELRTLAELALARAQLAAGDRYAASTTIDATLESLAELPLELERLGPSLGALVEERRRLLEARGSTRLRVECSEPCRVLIDERNIGEVEAGGAHELGLPLGVHRIWIESAAEHTQPSHPPLRVELDLDSVEHPERISYPRASELPAPALPSRGASGSSRRQADPLAPGSAHRTAPRWAELTALIAGGAALVAGAALWAIDSSCPGGADINDPLACPELFDTKNAGIALVSAGFAAAVTGGVMLVVDETRLGQRRGHELGLIWTARF